MELAGKIIAITETQEYGSKGFLKREAVIETLGQYPQNVQFDFVQDKTSLLDNFDLDQVVKISFNIRSNEHNGRYYTNLQGWKIELSNETGSSVDQYKNS